MTIDGGREFRAAANVLVSPTYAPDLVDATLDLVLDGACGVWHLANQGCVSWYEFAVAAARKSGRDVSRIVPASGADIGWVARRPVWSPLASIQGIGMPDLESAIERFVWDGGWSAVRDGERDARLHA